MATFGHRQLGIFFRPLLSVSDDGFNFRGKKYSWSDVVQVKRTEYLPGIFSGMPVKNPRASVLLKDGCCITLYKLHLEKGENRPAIRLFSCPPHAYNELIALFEKYCI